MDGDLSAQQRPAVSRATQYLAVHEFVTAPQPVDLLHQKLASAGCTKRGVRRERRKRELPSHPSFCRKPMVRCEEAGYGSQAREVLKILDETR